MEFEECRKKCQVPIGLELWAEAASRLQGGAP
jgi:hypothetical protein